MPSEDLLRIWKGILKSSKFYSDGGACSRKPAKTILPDWPWPPNPANFTPKMRTGSSRQTLQMLFSQALPPGQIYSVTPRQIYFQVCFGCSVALPPLDQHGAPEANLCAAPAAHKCLRVCTRGNTDRCSPYTTVGGCTFVEGKLSS